MWTSACSGVPRRGSAASFVLNHPGSHPSRDGNAGGEGPLLRRVQARYHPGGRHAIDRLLPTKLAIPRPSRPPVSRPRLAELLGGASTARLVVVSAPPGFGKTTALLDWLATVPARTSWLTLDEADNDPSRFLRYLWAAVARLAGAADPIGPGGAGDAADPLDTVAEMAALLAGCAEQSILVLDDYQVITAPDVQRSVGVLLEQLPPQAHLVVATRVDPPLPLARLRARGELVEIRAEDLRFTADEGARFFAQRMGLALSDEDVRSLVDRTEGWPAVLQLAGLALTGRSDVAVRIRDFAATHRFVLDYIVEEVLAGLPAATHEFLLRTSILDRLCGPLCEAVTGRPGGQETLEALDRANLLIVALDDERRWFRYHALFAEFLRLRLAALHPEEVRELHAAASAWHEAQGGDEEAIAHALRSGDVERMSRLVAWASGPHLSAGELSTVRRWLDALPTGAVADHAQLSASYAWCLLLLHERDGVAERLADAERALAAGRDGGPVLRAGIPVQLAILRSQLAGLEDDVDRATAQARLALDLVPSDLPPDAQAAFRGTALDMLGLALLRGGDLDAASEAYEAALPALRAAANSFALGRTLYDLTKIAIQRGDPDRALRLLEEELADPASASDTNAAIWAALALAHEALHADGRATAAARRSLELAAHSGDVPIAKAARAALARLERAAAPAGPATHERIVATAGGPVEALTDRELEVLRLVALGRSNAQVARELFVTVGTVKSHLHTISGKLGAANRVEAVARGRGLGLLD